MKVIFPQNSRNQTWLGLALLSLAAGICLLGCDRDATKSAKHGSATVEADRLRAKTRQRNRRPRTDAEKIRGIPFQFEPADFSGQWVAGNDSNRVRIFLMDASGSENIREQVDSLSVMAVDGAIFTLDPDPVDGAKFASYSLDNPQLAIAMDFGAMVVMEYRGKSYRAKIAGGPH